jgi:hypothetical protein
LKNLDTNATNLRVLECFFKIRFKKIEYIDLPKISVFFLDIITRIVKDYDLYVRRNLKRGYNRKELNVGPIHASRIKTSENLSKIKTEIKDRLTGLKNKK